MGHSCPKFDSFVVYQKASRLWYAAFAVQDAHGDLYDETKRIFYCPWCGAKL